MDIFDSLGRLGSVDVSETCGTLYNVARSRLVGAFNPRVRQLDRGRRLALRRAVFHLTGGCSNCRFYRSASIKLFGPFDLLGMFRGLGFNGF